MPRIIHKNEAGTQFKVEFLPTDTEILVKYGIRPGVQKTLYTSLDQFTDPLVRNALEAAEVVPYVPPTPPTQEELAHNEAISILQQTDSIHGARGVEDLTNLLSSTGVIDINQLPKEFLERKLLRDSVRSDIKQGE